MGKDVSSDPKTKLIHRIEVVRELCIGATTCVVVSPQAFEMDDDSIAVVKENGEKISDDELLMAAQSCPTAAIILYDKDGNKIFPKDN